MLISRLPLWVSIFNILLFFDGLQYCYSFGQLHIMTLYYILGLSTDYSYALWCSALCSTLFHTFYLVFISLLLISDFSVTALDSLCFSYHITHASNLFLTLSDVFPSISDSATFQSLVSSDFPSTFSPYSFMFPIVAKYFAHWLRWPISHIDSPPHFSAFSGVLFLHYLVFIPFIC
jgi:hypothetical protein